MPDDRISPRVIFCWCVTNCRPSCDPASSGGKPAFQNSVVSQFAKLNFLVNAQWAVYRIYLLGFPRCKRSIISIPMGQTINSVVCHMLKALYSAAVWGCPCLPQ